MVMTALIVAGPGLVCGVMAGHRSVRWRAERLARRLLGRWRSEHAAGVEQAAVRRSEAVLLGQLTEHLAPLLTPFEFDIADARFLGKPVDFIVFDGYTEVRNGRRDRLSEIVFVDIKTGKSGLSLIERRIKECVEDRRVAFVDLSDAAPDLAS